MAQTFDIINYLSGMTNFVFDKAVLNNIALECGVSEVTSFDEITQGQKDDCKIMLLEAIVFGPYQTASSTNQHGNWTKTVGAQTITSAALESIKAELRRLYKKKNDEDKLDALDDTDGEVKWINEYC